MSTKKLLSKANALSSSLDELEAKLEPILSYPLQENLESLEKLQQAKLNVLLPYLINDLIFSAYGIYPNLALSPNILPVYLKTRGVDPKTHPVVAELVRKVVLHSNNLRLICLILRIGSVNILPR